MQSKIKNYRYFHLICSLILSYSVYSQTIQERNAIIETYDLIKLNELFTNFQNNFILNYEIGIQMLQANKIPISGIDENGDYYSIKGFDSESKDVLFYKTYNNTNTKSSIQTSRLQNVHNGQAVGLNIKGENMILGIWDGGQPLASHQDLGIQRVINKDGEFTTGESQNAQQNGINHATHVSGTMIGNGIFKLTALGGAPKAILWANTWDNDLAEMTLEASQGLLISNHSYGISNRSYVNLPGIFGRYTPNSQDIDELTYLADMYLPVYAAGNDRDGIFISGNLIYLNESKSGYDLLTHENVAKNPVVVAAVHGITNYVFTNTTTNNVVMSNFSQWGPTDDFRIKPDISTKGVAVYSSTGTSNSSYSTLNGTSMAAPNVSAVFILWQKYHSILWPNANNNSGYMKAASVKALMAHTASEAGNAEGPDAKFGWGLINAEEGVKTLKDAKENQVIFQELTINNSETHEFNINLDGSKPLTVTISWTDPAGNVSQIAESTVPVLVNDLDVRGVRKATNQIFYPWRLNKSWSNPHAERGDNDVDPIEKITYYNLITSKAEAGEYSVIINHKNELLSPVNFSIIISGGVTDFNHTVDNYEFIKEDVLLFPNPAHDYIFISNLEFDNIEIFDLLGKKINCEVEEEFNFIKINISNLKNGIYILALKKEFINHTFKFIKK